MSCEGRTISARWAWRGSLGQSRPAFTLIELLVVVAVIALLIGLLVPTLGRSREIAQNVQCLSGLRQIAIATVSYGASNRGYYCSGPFDNRRGNSYGPIDEAGWLADMVNGQYLIPGNLLCPTAPARYTQNMLLERLDDGRPQTEFDAEERDELIDRGFNTNYTLSWYMGFTEMREPANASVGSSRSVNSVVGPLRADRIRRVATSVVPLMGDARAKEEGDEYGIIKGERVRTAKAMTDGPVGYFSGWWGRQSYEDFGPAHLSGKRNEDGHNQTRGNFAFADGHADFVTDANHDGHFGWPEGEFFVHDRYPDPEMEERVFGGHLTTGHFRAPGSIGRAPGTPDPFPEER